MPNIKTTFTPKFPFTIGHFNTIFKTIFTSPKIKYTRKRVELKDGDFLDLDFSKVSSDTIAIITHGLEGSSNSKYTLQATATFNQNKIDAVVLNLRGCSGEPNRLLSTYHSGKTDDLDTVIRYINTHYNYKKIILIGYSLGGNITLKYTGEQGSAISSKIKCVIAISVPCDLTGSAAALGKFENKIYTYRFLKTLKTKALHKLEKFPDSFLNKETILAAKNFNDFDDLYTAPAHGFENAADYWLKSSSKTYLSNIKTPTLLINALDDSFLSKECYPYEIAKDHTFLHLETPKHGGHVGFNSKLMSKDGYWLEKRIIEFTKNY